MTAAEPTATPSGAPDAPTEACRRKADRVEKWSIAWMLMAMVMWGVFLFLLLADYGPQIHSYDGTESLCRGPLIEPSPTNNGCGHDELRQWPALLGILALAVVPTVAAAATTVYAKVLSRLAQFRAAGSEQP
ncbi:hypothetical protein ACIF83_26185 [Streptomyces sp. NPDC085866]|uniref:hypothetical protein n=1 Tax=unclassified Streptomyces TaxID=2593676 RepID=UPI0037BB902E